MRAWVELAGAWSLAIAYPMFQNIASGPEALTHLGAGTFEIAVAVVILVCLVPTVLLAVERAISRFGRPVAPGSQSTAHEYVEPGLIDSFYAPAPANMAVFDARLAEAALGAGERVAIAHGGRVLATARTHRGEDSELRVTVVLGPSPTERSRSEPLEVYPIG